MPGFHQLLQLAPPTRFETLGDALAEWRVQLSHPPFKTFDGRDDWYAPLTTAEYWRSLIIDLLPHGQAWLGVFDAPVGWTPAWWEFARADLNYWLLYRALEDSHEPGRRRAICDAMGSERAIQRRACELERVRGHLR